MDSKPSAGAPAVESAAHKEAIDRLGGYQTRKSLESVQAVDQRMIWALPAIFAAVIMVVFALIFKDDGAQGDVKEEDLAKAAAAEKQP